MLFEDKLVAIPMLACFKLYVKDNELFDNPTPYRSTVGALQYLTMTMSNLSFIVNKLIQVLKAFTRLQW